MGTHCAQALLLGVWGNFGLPRVRLPGRTRNCTSHACDDAQVLQALPGQADDERVELLTRERCMRLRTTARPHETALVEPARGAPHAKAVVHHELHARAALVGEEVTVVGLR